MDIFRYPEMSNGVPGLAHACHIALVLTIRFRRDRLQSDTVLRWTCGALQEGAKMQKTERPNADKQHVLYLPLYSRLCYKIYVQIYSNTSNPCRTCNTPVVANIKLAKVNTAVVILRTNCTWLYFICSRISRLIVFQKQ